VQEIKLPVAFSSKSQVSFFDEIFLTHTYCVFLEGMRCCLFLDQAKSIERNTNIFLSQRWAEQTNKRQMTCSVFL